MIFKLANPTAYRLLPPRCSIHAIIMDFAWRLSPSLKCMNSFRLTFQDKPALFRSFYKWLKPGGKILISDYCKSAGTPSPEFTEYIRQRGYDLHGVEAYGQVYICN